MSRTLVVTVIATSHILLALAACGDMNTPAADGGWSDGATPVDPADAPIGDDAGASDDGGAACTLGQLSATAVAMADPSILLVADGAAIDRHDGSTRQLAWARLTRGFVRSMVTAPDGMVYISSDHGVYRADTRDTSPTVETVAEFTAPGYEPAYALAVAPDGTVFHADQRPSGLVVVAIPPGGLRHDVTTAPLPGVPGGLVVDASGDLLMLTLFGHALWRIDLDDGRREQARRELYQVTGASGLNYGLALDDAGRALVSTSSTRRVIRVSASFDSEEVLAALPDVIVPTNMAFGRGCWGETSLYVAGFPVTRIEAGSHGVP